MGILVGWIIRKRWMTIAAFALTFVGAFTLPRLPSPGSYTVLLTPVILITAIIYEGGSVPGLIISSRLRLALALWIGFSTFVLMTGILFAGSNSLGVIATIAIFSVLAMAGVVTIGMLHRRQLRDLAKARGNEPSGSSAR